MINTETATLYASGIKPNPQSKNRRQLRSEHDGTA